MSINKMNYPNLPAKDDAPIYTANDMRKYVDDAIEANDLYYDDLRKAQLEISKLQVEVKVKDSAMRTMQTELLQLRNRVDTGSSYTVHEVQRLRLRVQQLEKQNSEYSWAINPDRMGQ